MENVTSSAAKKSALSWGGIFALFLILILVNAIGRFAMRNWYVDLTADRQYSLSQGTKNIVGQIGDPITLRYYFSKTDGAGYPTVKLWGERVGDLLREYERVGKGKIVLETYDPRPDSDEEDWAQKYGLTAIPTREGEQLYVGLAAISGSGKEQVLPVFDFQRQEYLEYDITRAISSLSKETRPVVAILSSLKVNGGAGAPTQENPRPEPREPWFFTQQLEELFDVQYLDPLTETIPDGVSVLIVMHLKNPTTGVQYAIDQFVMKGGNLIAMVDPYCQSDEPEGSENNPMLGMGYDRSSSLSALLNPWGIILRERNVVGDLSLSARVSTQRGAEPKNFINWLLLTRQAGRDVIRKDDLVTGSLETVLLPWAGAFEVKPVEGVEVTTLLQSTAESMLVSEEQYRFNGGDPDTLLRRFSPGDQPYPLALRIRGKLKSAFQGGTPGGTKVGGSTHLSEGVKTANVIAIADADFVADRFSVAVQNLFGAKIASLLNDNLNLLLNSVENLSGSDDLIGIRSRGQLSRPFREVQKLEAAAQQRWQLEEMRLQAELNGANDRLNQIQASAGGEGAKQVFNKAVLEEIKQFREQKNEAQRNLRVVRRNLRQDIEQLGEKLFLANTFGVPLLLIAFYVFYRFRIDGAKRTSQDPV